LVPSSAPNVGVFDPRTNAFRVVDISDTVSGIFKYNGGVLAPNGKVSPSLLNDPLTLTRCH